VEEFKQKLDMQVSLERCAIREWRLDDAPSLTRHANNRRVWLGLRDFFPHPYAIENGNEFLRQATAEKPTTKFCIDIEDAAAGGIGIRIGEDVHRHVGQLGYWLGEEFWGRGIMTEAVSEFVNYCFKKFPLHRIYAEAYANNLASARVLEKAGFVLEGRLRKNVVKDGKVLDSLLFAKTV
jgi:ribosomal-protein-alanine N-acetyltransferase